MTELGDLYVDWDQLDEVSCVDELRMLLAAKGVLTIGGFPTDVSRFVDLLSALGEPLEYYGGGVGSHPGHSAVWRVRYDEAANQRSEAHAADGPLMVHSSQSLRDPRPKYFAMLMVNAGWQTQPPGFNGESLLTSWRDAFRHLRSHHLDQFEQMRRLLMSEIPFPDGLRRSLAYEIDGMADRHDLGVRLNSDLLDHLLLGHADEPTTEAVQMFCSAAEAVARRVQLREGDLVLVDNDRWGHGRESVVGARQSASGVMEFNPRELWSATVQSQ